MDVKYQVFLSSTFVDLKEERYTAIKAINEIGAIPSGMEYFPASDEGAWEVIRDMIDESDYYIVIIGRRYGSLNNSGISFTEMEYDYAKKENKYILPFIISDRDKIKSQDADKDEIMAAKLEKFITKLEENHTCKQWRDSKELAANITASLARAISKHPTGGWVRAAKVPDMSTLENILSLRNENDALKKKLEESETGPAEGSEIFVQGDEEIKINITITYKNEFDIRYSEAIEELHIKINDVWGAIAPSLLERCDSETVKNEMRKYIIALAKYQLNIKERYDTYYNYIINISNHSMDTFIIQFIVLGMMKDNSESGLASGAKIRWILTPYGKQLLMQIRAVKRKTQS